MGKNFFAFTYVCVLAICLLIYFVIFRIAVPTLFYSREDVTQKLNKKVLVISVMSIIESILLFFVITMGSRYAEYTLSMCTSFALFFPFITAPFENTIYSKFLSRNIPSKKDKEISENFLRNFDDQTFSMYVLKYKTFLEQKNSKFDIPSAKILKHIKNFNLNELRGNHQKNKEFKEGFLSIIAE